MRTRSLFFLITISNINSQSCISYYSLQQRSPILTNTSITPLNFTLNLISQWVSSAKHWYSAVASSSPRKSWTRTRRANPQTTTTTTIRTNTGISKTTTTTRIAVNKMCTGIRRISFQHLSTERRSHIFSLGSLRDKCRLLLLGMETRRQGLGLGNPLTRCE